jgi:hypothetical protein
MGQFSKKLQKHSVPTQTYMGKYNRTANLPYPISNNVSYLAFFLCYHCIIVATEKLTFIGMN